MYIVRKRWRGIDDRMRRIRVWLSINGGDGARNRRELGDQSENRAVCFGQIVHFEHKSDHHQSLAGRLIGDNL